MNNIELSNEEIKYLYENIFFAKVLPITNREIFLNIKLKIENILKHSNPDYFKCKLESLEKVYYKWEEFIIEYVDFYKKVKITSYKVYSDKLYSVNWYGSISKGKLFIGSKENDLQKVENMTLSELEYQLATIPVWDKTRFIENKGYIYDMLINKKKEMEIDDLPY